METGFETGQMQPKKDPATWIMNNLTKPSCKVVAGAGRDGGAGLVIAGDPVDSKKAANIYYFILDAKVPVEASTDLRYWIKPENEAGRHVGIELFFSDGSSLRDSAARDQAGRSLHPATPKGAVGEWTLIESSIGVQFSGRVVTQILLAYEGAPDYGSFKAAIDDLYIGPAPRPSKEEGRFRIKTDAARPLIHVLGWNPEGEPFETYKNMLAAPAELQVLHGNQWQSSTTIEAAVAGDGKTNRLYTLKINPQTIIAWEIRNEGGRGMLVLSGEGPGLKDVQGLRLVLPLVKGPSVLPSQWDETGPLQFPIIIFAQKHGQMRIACAEVPEMKGSCAGSTLTMDLPAPQPKTKYHIELTPFALPQPPGFKNEVVWEKARLNWLGPLTPSAKPPFGILANNPHSDVASCSIWFYADQAFFHPEPTPGVKVMTLVRDTIDFWITKKVEPTGEVICYWSYLNFLDANSSPLLSAWDYLEITGDKDWLQKRIERLEFIAEFLAKRDVDNDGMVEATQSGNLGTLQQPARSCNWFDALNCGHKDGFPNALIYRAWRCLADLEDKLGRTEQCSRYNKLADRLKAIYAKTLLNPKTGWLAGWKSADGELHDYASTAVNGMAIEYGLVAPRAAKYRRLLETLWTGSWYNDYSTVQGGHTSVIDVMQLAPFFYGIASEEHCAAVRPQVEKMCREKPQEWPPIMLMLAESAYQVGCFGDLAAMVAERVEHIYSTIDAPRVRPDSPLPGVQHEYWPRDKPTWGAEGYGWGTFGIALLLRYMVGWREDGPLAESSLTLAPALPPELCRPGQRFHVHNLPALGRGFELSYEVAEDGNLQLTLSATRGPRIRRIRIHDLAAKGHVLAAGKASLDVRIRNNERYRIVIDSAEQARTTERAYTRKGICTRGSASDSPVGV